MFFYLIQINNLNMLNNPSVFFTIDVYAHMFSHFVIYLLSISKRILHDRHNTPYIIQ